jgi:hypothetical protein
MDPMATDDMEDILWDFLEGGRGVYREVNDEEDAPPPYCVVDQESMDVVSGGELPGYELSGYVVGRQ